MKYKIVLTSDPNINLTDKLFNTPKEAEDHLRMYFWCGTCQHRHSPYFGLCADYQVTNIETGLPEYSDCDEVCDCKIVVSDLVKHKKKLKN